jgi:hypothetical protein
MKSNLIVLALIMLLVPNWASAQVSTAPPTTPGTIIPKLLIDPSSTSVSLGKVSLSVDPLNHKGGVYVGDYQLKVVPYFFRSEKGTLKLEASDDTMHKLLGGIPVKFTGKASNNKNGKPKVITGNATPLTNDKGSVTFSVETDNGPMIFKTSYHVGE